MRTPHKDDPRLHSSQTALSHLYTRTNPLLILSHSQPRPNYYDQGSYSQQPQTQQQPQQQHPYFVTSPPPTYPGGPDSQNNMAGMQGLNNNHRQRSMPMDVYPNPIMGMGGGEQPDLKRASVHDNMWNGR